MQIHIKQSGTKFVPAQKKRELSNRIANNLAEWGYLIPADDAKEFSHDLTVTIGNVQSGSTPVGFSFSAGNSDPRAVNFQKTDILPITCSLTAKDQAKQVSAELSMDFNADEYPHYNKAGQRQGELFERLVNDSSLVCYNLLTGLNAPTPVDKSNTPAWTPEIIIENEPAAEPPLQNGLPAQQKRIEQEPRKRIVIKNQGTPVIFTFGHQRK